MFGILCVCFGLIPLINAVPEFEDGDLRLLGGSTENEGTVLIYHNGRWGSICDRGWDIRDGNVACYQLGFQRALQTLRYSPFGPGRTFRWLTGLRCRGRESRLDQCHPRQWGIERDQRYCSRYSRSAAVVCLPHSTTTSTTTPSTTTTKTTTTTTAKQTTQSTKKSTVASVGLAVNNIIPTRRAIDAIEHNRDKEEEKEEETKTVVERYSNNTIIFDDKDRDDIDNDDQDYESDEEDAEDNNENAIQSTARSRSQPRRSHLQFDAEWSETRRTKDRDVITTASPLKESTSTSRPPTTKEHSRAAAPAPVGPNRYDEEVYSISLPSRRWTKDPLLKCWVLLTYREEILIAKPGQRPSRITKEEYYKKRRAEIIKQRGEETIPNEINRSPLNDASGSRTGNTGNNQIVDRGRVPTTTTKCHIMTTTTTTEAAAPAPVSAYENEVFSVELVTSKWIKDEELNMWVMLSRSGGVSVAKPGQRAVKIDEDEYYQMRREAIIKARDRLKADDPSPGQVPAPSTRQLSFGRGGGTIRSRNEDASSSSNIVISSDLNITREHARGNHHRNRHGHGSKKIETRLGGSRSNRGRLEVRLKGREEWGVVCGDHWTIKEAMVVCRDMNAGYGQQAIKRAVFGGINMKKYFSRVRCKGTEKRLEDCQWEDHEMSIQCTSSDSVAGVICASALPDLEPSIYMLETSSFLQDRHLYYLQCAMEEKCLAPSAYEAQRSRGWRAHTRRLLRFSSVVKNKGTADFRPMLNRDEWEWHACHMHYHSMDVFAHYDILDTNGNRVAEGLKASFCLEDSACDRGVRPKYSCQNYGQQGISVGCSDNYMADIDCQWVDITDLKQGKYVFKVEINPNLIVAEISYDNNVVVCDLNYTGYYARIYNCKHEGLL
uniref:protein-lysine 6-oxidase n=1 Tax=Magallana gigas TaxID=29159 RepID=K1PQV8_MAGGI